MNETEKERILKMVSEGMIRPAEASQLLAALAGEEAKSGKAPEKDEEKKEEKPKEPLLEIQMQRPDGSHYTVQVPPNLFPMFWQIAKVAIRESVRTAAKETWGGFKTVVRNKTDEVKSNVKSRVSGSKTEAVPALNPGEEQQFAARRHILQMVQNGRITATDASRLIQQLDALQEYEKKNPPTTAPPVAIAK